MPQDRIEPAAPVSAALRTLHSPEFVTAWRALVQRTFRVREEEGCVRVRGLLGGTTLSYLPLLNYSDLGIDAAHELARRCGARPYLVRALDWQTPAAPGDAVTMRLVLAGHDHESLWMRGLDGKCRNQVRKAQRSQLVVRSGATPDLVDDFHALLARTLHRHGAPVLPRALLQNLARDFACRFHVAYGGGAPVAAIVAITDHDLVWVPWAAADPASFTSCPNHIVYWTAIEEALAAGKALFDFGRSPYGGSTHRFKQQWGATDVRIALFSSSPAGVYDKYATAQRLWRKLPAAVVDRVGPWLCAYLPDY